MGYTLHCGATRAELIADLLKDANWQGKTSTSTLLAHACVGNDLWMIIERTQTDGTPTYRFAHVCMMSGGKEGWGYRDYDEGSGPYKWNIPASLFAMLTTPPTSEYSKEWREKVRATLADNAAARCLAATIRAGDTVQLAPNHSGRTFVIERKEPRKFYAHEVGDSYTLYFIRPASLKGATIVSRAQP